MNTLLLAFALSQEIPQVQPNNTLWKASLATYAAANVADLTSGARLASNPAYRETNPLMQSTAAAVGIKAGIIGAVVVTNWLVLRRHPEQKKMLAILNFGASAAPLAAAIHNGGLR